MAQSIPKKIFSFWLQGIEAAPDIVKFNWHRWERLNPEYELIILDKSSAKNALSGFPEWIDQVLPQTYSDILRYRLLWKDGGIWIDSTVFPVRPLREWLSDTVADSDFFAFSFPDNDRLLDNWFLVARPRSLIMDRWFTASLSYWSRERILLDLREVSQSDSMETLRATRESGLLQDRYQYFWSHYLFAELVESDMEFARAWNLMNKIPISSATSMQWYFLRNESAARSMLLRILPMVDRVMLKRYGLMAPVHKLNWRKNYPLHLLDEL